MLDDVSSVLHKLILCQFKLKAQLKHIIFVLALISLVKACCTLNSMSIDELLQ